ncbi:MAG: 3,4-dihydroxy-2-butanone-4-phosphate synthase, partial [Deltaproteobacteria bacterium]|nr:3,4-dihydroxy-2-butanone-4-phosphate synthase [Deltaproteobacteria bacterium]
MRNESITRVHRALEAIRAGKMVVMVDDEDRENEGDLVMAAEKVTPESINFMARFGRGLICLTLEPDRLSALGIPMMVDNNYAAHGTAFTVSIEARYGVTTGISAADRAHTIQVAISDAATHSDLVSPGHVFPLRSMPGGVLQRTGHTEGSVDLARLAGCKPAGVICEIMNDDGTMARLPQLELFCREHGLFLLSIADLIQYRLQKERLIRKIAEGDLALAPSRMVWKAHVFEYDSHDAAVPHQMLALTLGEIDASPILVRVHVGSVLGDIFGARAGIRMVASEAIRRIEAEGRGVVLYIPQRLDLVNDLYYHLGRDVK